MYVSCIIMLYALNMYSDACQSFLNKTGEDYKLMMVEGQCFLFLCFYHNIVWCIFILHRCVCVCVSVFKGRGNFVRSFSSVSTVLASVEIKQPPAERNKHQKCILFSNKRVSQCIPSAFHPKWWSDKCFFFFLFFLMVVLAFSGALKIILPLLMAIY